MSWDIHKILELEQHEIVKVFIEDRSVRLYPHGVTGKTGAMGLCRIVKRVSGREPNLKEAHVFWVKDAGSGVKIIRRSLAGINLIEFYIESSRDFQDYLVELGLT
nr:hypothetical protein [Pedobacter panaciterrae]